MKRGMIPAHPGEVLKGLYLDPLNVTITDAAGKLGITRKSLSQLVNGRVGVSAEMAIRLSKALKTTPELWLNMQRNYDLWKAGKTMGKVKIGNIRRPANIESKTEQYQLAFSKRRSK